MKNKNAEEIAELARQLKENNPHAAVCLLIIASALCDDSINELMMLMNVHSERRHVINSAMVAVQAMKPNLN